MLLVLVVAVAAATAWATFDELNEEPPTPPPPLRFTFPAPAGADFGAGDSLLDAALSPDDTQVVFVATTAAGSRLWLRSLNADTAEPLAATDGASQPAWKHTGRVISFFAAGKLRQISLDDRAVRDVTDAPAATGATWLVDGSLLVGSIDGPLRRLRNGTESAATSIQPGDAGHVFPSSSDGEAFTYVAIRTDGSRVVRLMRNGTSGDLAPTSANALLIDDQLLHVRDGALMATRVDPEAARTTGRSAVVAPNVAVSSTGLAAFAGSRRLLITVPATPRMQELVWLDTNGQRGASVSDHGEYWQARLSPDDRHVAVTMIDPLLKTLEIMTLPTDRPGDRQKLSLALAADTDPVWAPDGARVVFRSMEDAKPALYWRRPHDPQAPIEPGEAGDYTPTDWRAGSVLVTVASNRNLDVYAINRVSGARTPIATTGFNESEARWSPDGRWIALVSDESGEPDVYVLRGNARTRVSLAGGRKPRWSRDGRTLYFLRGEQLLRADLSGDGFSAPRLVATVPGVRDIDAAHRSDRLLAVLALPGAPVTATVTVHWKTPLATAQAEPRRR